MAGPVLLWRGRHLYLIRAPGASPQAIPLVGDVEEVAAQLLGIFPPRVDPSVLTRAGIPPGTAVGVESPVLAEILSLQGWPPRELPASELRLALERLPAPEGSEDRELAIAAARTALAAAMEDPVEVLLALAREEERLERAIGRERNAAGEFAGVAVPVLEEYAERQGRFFDAFHHHHAELEAHLEAEVVAIAPSLSAVVGPKVAARLIASAGGLQPLARMPASRLQLLGARRRPSHGRGPRYGLLFRAARMDEVPLGRQGAYARSLAALAAIAVRLDLGVPRRDRSAALVARRDRRVQTLARRTR